MRDIRIYSQYLNESSFALVDFFLESSYKDSKGEVRPCYRITQKGCELIAHKMTGAKGVQFSAWYINKFHEMENTLVERTETSQYINTDFMPKVMERLLTATEIGKILGLSKRRVGQITNRYVLKTSQYGKWINCLAPSGKPIKTFLYYPIVIEEIKKLM